MAAMHDDGEVGFEEGMLWLPSHVLDEACGTKECMRNRYQKVQNHHQMRQLGHQKSPGEPKPQFSKSTSRSSYTRPKLANGGPGMRVIFLGSAQRSCGTGVFLPQRAGTNFQPSKRPACAPVLLPARVVQALNLNARTLGVQISPPQVQRYNPIICREACNNNSIETKSGQKDASKQCSFTSQNRSSSPEIFLPKEWTY
ncbi:hypothetical protein PHAVU_007G171600 [Phaseolus vulgaris]|uniref:Uncharacterized protein n=1 Tax=Phaseolus vulgaris TaxID=3885 RepID=V7BFH8_PHAVU|nr:hypothetical protein PHAVU_007G171600g [Phaseolus vulgaris]ESW16624.1 hypothetical protein PHAVU_007G171600g [Phaseolus vulgaris]